MGVSRFSTILSSALSVLPCAMQTQQETCCRNCREKTLHGCSRMEADGRGGEDERQGCLTAIAGQQTKAAALGQGAPGTEAGEGILNALLI